MSDCPPGCRVNFNILMNLYDDWIFLGYPNLLYRALKRLIQKSPRALMFLAVCVIFLLQGTCAVKFDFRSLLTWLSVAYVQVYFNLQSSCFVENHFTWYRYKDRMRNFSMANSNHKSKSIYISFLPCLEVSKCFVIRSQCSAILTLGERSWKSLRSI